MQVRLESREQPKVDVPDAARLLTFVSLARSRDRQIRPVHIRNIKSETGVAGAEKPSNGQRVAKRGNRQVRVFRPIKVRAMLTVHVPAATAAFEREDASVVVCTPPHDLQRDGMPVRCQLPGMIQPKASVPNANHRRYGLHTRRGNGQRQPLEAFDISAAPKENHRTLIHQHGGLDTKTRWCSSGIYAHRRLASGVPPSSGSARYSPISAVTLHTGDGMRHQWIGAVVNHSSFACLVGLLPSAAHWTVRTDGFATGEHGHQRRDFARAAGGRLHRIGAEREREEVLLVEGAKSLLRTRVRIYADAQVARESRHGSSADRSVGRLPAAVALRSVDLALAVRRHTASGDESRDVLAVDLTPPALAPARRVPLQERPLVERLAEAVDPAPAQDDVERLRRRHRREPRQLLVDLDPHLRLAVVICGEPRFERGLALEALDAARIGNEGSHCFETASQSIQAAGSNKARGCAATTVSACRIRRAGDTRRRLGGRPAPGPTSRCALVARGRATDTCPRGCPARACTPSRSDLETVLAEFALTVEHLHSRSGGPRSEEH